MKYIYAIHPPLVMTIVSLAMVRVSVIFLLTFILFTVDTYGRTKDFFRLKNKPASWYTQEIILLYGRSWCGRTLMKALHPNARSIYADAGYRWWHFLPDGSLRRNSPLLKINFWSNLAKGH